MSKNEKCLELEDSKYYVPEIEEFHVGFEFEIFDGSEWIKDKITLWSDLKSLFDCEDKCPLEYRVKYLDREDIEGLGGEHFWNEYNYNWYIFNNIYKIKHNANIGNLLAILLDPTDFMLFSGTIKNKSELKQLLNFLKL